MIKYFYVFFVSLLLFSCANNMEAKKSMENISVSEKEVVEELFQNYDLTKQKLQDYFDLLVLQNKNTNFKDEIAKQLKDYSNATLVVSDTSKLNIKNIQLLDKIEKLNDSVKKIKISFDIVSSKTIKRDSIITIIKTKKVIIDDEVFISKKLQFVSF